MNFKRSIRTQKRKIKDDPKKMKNQFQIYINICYV